MTRSGMIISAVTGLTLLVGATGCATKGFVRNEVGTLRDETNRTDAALQSDISDARDSATSAQDRAEQAWLAAQPPSEFREVGRYRVHFAFDSAELDGPSRKTLDDAASLMGTNPNYVINVFGFCDEIGDENYNLVLGQRRAEAVIRHLADATGTLVYSNVLSFGEGAPRAEAASLGQGEEKRQVLIVVLEGARNGVPKSESPKGSELSNL